MGREKKKKLKKKLIMIKRYNIRLDFSKKKKKKGRGGEGKETSYKARGNVGSFLLSALPIRREGRKGGGKDAAKGDLPLLYEYRCPRAEEKKKKRGRGGVTLILNPIICPFTWTKGKGRGGEKKKKKQTDGRSV